MANASPQSAPLAIHGASKNMRDKVVAHAHVGVRDGDRLARCLSTQELVYEREKITKEQRAGAQVRTRVPLPTTIFGRDKVAHTRTQHTTNGRMMEEVARGFRRGDVAYGGVSRRGTMAPGVVHVPARPRVFDDGGARSPRFLTAEGDPRKPKTLRPHEVVAAASAADVDVITNRIDATLLERRALEARLAALGPRDDADRALPRYYLETYQEPMSARPVCGERKGKIFTH